MSVETRLSPRGLTTADVARIFRVSEDKVRRWLATGELVGTNTATTLSGRPRWVITPEAIDAFKQRRTSAPTPVTPRRKRHKVAVDFYP